MNLFFGVVFVEFAIPGPPSLKIIRSGPFRKKKFADPCLRLIAHRSASRENADNLQKRDTYRYITARIARETYNKNASCSPRNTQRNSLSLITRFLCTCDHERPIGSKFTKSLSILFRYTHYLTYTLYERFPG